VTIAGAIAIGVTLITAAVLWTLHVVLVRQWRGMALSLWTGNAYELCDVLAMSEPPHGAAIRTLVQMTTSWSGVS